MAVSRLIQDKWEYGRVSNNALAAAVGVEKRTVGRWLRGESRPSPEMQAAIEQWAAEIRGDGKR